MLKSRDGDFRRWFVEFVWANVAHVGEFLEAPCRGTKAEEARVENLLFELFRDFYYPRGRIWRLGTPRLLPFPAIYYQVF